MDNRPIGVFDSGLGGLTSLKELRRLMPGEDIVYFGDTGRVPYGTKGRDTIIKYTGQILRFMRGFDVKAVVAACNTVSAVAFGEDGVKSEVPLLGAVVPAAQAAARATKNGRIGILGTAATVRSGAYGKALRGIRPDAQIKSLACPLFVPLVESGHFAPGDKLALLAAEEYLAAFDGWGEDTMILGCTHYPVLRGVIGGVLGSGVTLIDSSREAAAAAQNFLSREGLLASKTTGGSCRFYVSDYSEDFARLAGILLEQPIEGNIERVDIEKY